MVFILAKTANILKMRWSYRLSSSEYFYRHTIRYGIHSKILMNYMPNNLCRTNRVNLLL